MTKLHTAEAVHYCAILGLLALAKADPVEFRRSTDTSVFQLNLRATALLLRLTEAQDPDALVLQRYREEFEQLDGEVELVGEFAARMTRLSMRPAERPMDVAQQQYEVLLAKKQQWFEDAARVDAARHGTLPTEELTNALGELRHFLPAACHWTINVAIERLTTPRE